MTQFSKSLIILPLFVALAASFGAASAPAFAQDHARGEAVRYTDLNLAHEDGVKTLDQRLHGAVNRACGGGSARGATELVDLRMCQAVTWNTIEPQRAAAIDAAKRESIPTVEIARNTQPRRLVLRIAD